MKNVRLIALLALFGCEKSSSEEPAPSPKQDGVQLLSLGNEPQRILQYHLKKGAHTALEMAMNLDLDVSPRPTKMPTIVMVLDIAVEDVLASGSARVKTRVTAVKLLDRPTATLDAVSLGPMSQMLTGMVYTSTLAPDGSMSNGQIAGGTGQLKTQLEDLTRAIEQVAMRLPTVPVGVGSKWSSKKTTKQNGVEITTVTTTQLTAIDGDKLEFASETTLSAPDQKTSQQGTTVEISDVGGGGSAKGGVDLSTMAMHGTISSEFRGTVAVGGESSAMRVVMELVLK